jgi:hypothetical protein
MSPAVIIGVHRLADIAPGPSGWTGLVTTATIAIVTIGHNSPLSRARHSSITVRRTEKNPQAAGFASPLKPQANLPITVVIS